MNNDFLKTLSTYTWTEFARKRFVVGAKVVKLKHPYIKLVVYNITESRKPLYLQIKNNNTVQYQFIVLPNDAVILNLTMSYFAKDSYIVITHNDYNGGKLCIGIKGCGKF